MTMAGKIINCCRIIFSTSFLTAKMSGDKLHSPLTVVSSREISSWIYEICHYPSLRSYVHKAVLLAPNQTFNSQLTFSSSRQEPSSREMIPFWSQSMIIPSGQDVPHGKFMAKTNPAPSAEPHPIVSYNPEQQALLIPQLWLSWEWCVWQTGAADLFGLDFFYCSIWFIHPTTFFWATHNARSSGWGQIRILLVLVLTN